MKLTIVAATGGIGRHLLDQALAAGHDVTAVVRNPRSLPGQVRVVTVADLAAADPAELETIIQSTGFFRNKTRSLMGMAAALVERFSGEVPHKLSDLVTLPGVGRKTGNVVRSVALGEPGLPVDTHVLRLSRRLGLTQQTDPVKVELELNPMVRADERGALSLRLILHGRRVCMSRKPRCDRCVLADICPSAFTF